MLPYFNIRYSIQRGARMDIYSYAYGNGAQNIGCAKGPAVLRKAIEKHSVASHCHWLPTLQTNSREQKRAALPDIAQLCETLAKQVMRSLSNQQFFLTLGGDHSAAIGSWSGASQAIASDLGLIWFDAHMDSHTFETTPSKNIHGMPLAVLLGHGEPALTQLLSHQPKLKPENVVLIGVRSFEAGEAALLKKLNVKIFYMHDIETLGLHTVLHNAVDIVTKNTSAFGISIDLDGFDPADAPGVGTPEKNGVHAEAFLKNFSIITTHPKLIGADIVEFNPTLDQKNKTCLLVTQLITFLQSSV